jgi:putative hydrolase of the HAD superfamily
MSARHRAVTFDCWGTLLVERDPGVAYGRRVEALAEAVARGGGAPDLAAARPALDAAWRRHVELWEAGVASGSPEMAAWSLEALAPERLEAAPALAERFVRIGLASEVRALPGAAETLRALSAEGVVLALVCDTGFSPGDVVRVHLERLGLLAFLPVTVFSDEAGVPKPDRRVFAQALGALGVAPAAAVHVGDLRRTDVAGGRGAGMGTVRLRAHYDDPALLPEADFVADSHAHLAELLLRAGD